ncbi:hypothetical protein B0H34DRAFT_707482 [Crassisporium funariophilum]|nr:hypothetical protein B0H34DRAFT_707482 [Crassisporium funariophilum]
MSSPPSPKTRPRGLFAPKLPPHLTQRRPRRKPKPPVELSDLDKWLKAALDDNGELVDQAAIPSSMPLLSDSILRDYIDCVLTLVKVEGAIDGPFQDPHSYSLHLHLLVPPTSGFLVYFRRSPSVILAAYIGHDTDPAPLAPCWIHDIQPRDTFRQPHTNTINALAYFATKPGNEHIINRVNEWCRVVSVRLILQR